MAKEKKTKKRRKRSLNKTIRRLVLVVAFVVFLVSVVLNGIFSKTELSTIVSINGHTILYQTSKMLEEAGDIQAYADRIMEVYRSVPEDIRSAGESEAYRAYFEQFADDATGVNAEKILEEIQGNMLAQSLYLVMYDTDTSAAVRLIRTASNFHNDLLYLPGQWEAVSDEEMKQFLEPNESTIMYGGSDGRGGEVITVGKQITDGEGRICCLIMLDIPLLMVDVTAGLFLVVYVLVLALITVLIVVICRHYVRRRIVNPIMQISSAAETYAGDRLKGDSVSSHFDKLDIHTRDELEELSTVMAGMEKDLTQYEKDLMQATATQERIQTELKLASGIQDRMLPSYFPAFPDRDDFDIYASMDPAKEVGGDFYDFFLVDEDHLAMVIADVSGKGIPAALFILNNYASLGIPPAEVLSRTNQKICELDLQNMFVTVWLGILDLKTGVVTAGNAGHEYPVVGQSGDQFRLMKDQHSLVIGALEDVPFDSYTFTLSEGGTLFLYTDGVPEATNMDNQMYGTERMVNALNQARTSDPEQLLEAVRKDVDAFVREAPQFDDLTMLCVRYNGFKK